MSTSTRPRRPHGELKQAMRYFLAQHDGPASIKQIQDGIGPTVGEAPASSYRSALQDTRYFQRVERGVFQLRPDTANHRG